jgi:magnesium-transporting ATPase (P-type)
MELTQRELVTMIHGMLFGGFFLLALFGTLVLLLERSSPDRNNPDSASAQPASRWQTTYFIVMVVFGWAAVLSGAYIIYPWYRAVAPAGADLALYPKFLLTAHPYTAGWHNFGMEWKEHVAWIAPMSSTMVAWVLLKHRAAWNAHRAIRNTVLGFSVTAFLAAAIAGGWGAMIDKKAPVQGGQSIQLMGSIR